MTPSTPKRPHAKPAALNLKTLFLSKKEERKVEKRVETDIENKFENKFENKLENKIERKVEADIEKRIDAKEKQETLHHPHEATHKLLAKSEVSVWIDTYDDIFSDFDPRPYRDRAMSVDFLDEAKRYTKEKKGKLNLRILAPNNIRNSRMEVVIKKRLLDHFKHNDDLLTKERSADVRRGVSLIALGSALLFSAALIIHYLSPALWRELLIVFMEPAGWFCFWVGFEQILYNNKKPEQEFYKKMSSVDITFDSY